MQKYCNEYAQTFRFFSYFVVTLNDLKQKMKAKN